MADRTPKDPLTPSGGLEFAPSPVPVLRLRGAMWDPVALDTWREALSSLVVSEVPHELLGLWLFTGNDEPVLLGPQELAADALDVPRPKPQVDPSDLWRLEERVRDAGYGSALAIAVPHGDRDVGLILLATLEEDKYHDREIAFVGGIVAGLGPTMARVSQQWGHEEEVEDDGEPRLYRRRNEPGRALHELRDLLADLADTVALSESPAGLADGLSHALSAMIPHDRVEILVPHPPKSDFYRLAAHADGPLFSNDKLWVPGSYLDPVELFGDDGVLIVRDADVDPRVPVWPSDNSERHEVKSVVGVRLGHANRPTGYLMLGCLGPGMYGGEDIELLKRLAPLITPRVDQFSLVGQVQTLRSHLGVLRQVPSHLGRIAELMATTPHLGVATRMFAEEASGVLQFERLEFALRVGREADVVVLNPGDSRPLSELQPVDVSGTELGRVIRSEITHALAAASQPSTRNTANPSAAVVVPLRVAGRVIGTMTLVATGSSSFGQTDVTLAQQLADIAAPHLEMVRRGALTSTGGRKRVGR